MACFSMFFLKGKMCPKSWGVLSDQVQHRQLIAEQIARNAIFEAAGQNIDSINEQEGEDGGGEERYDD